MVFQPVVMDFLGLCCFDTCDFGDVLYPGRMGREAFLGLCSLVLWLLHKSVCVTYSGVCFFYSSPFFLLPVGMNSQKFCCYVLKRRLIVLSFFPKESQSSLEVKSKLGASKQTENGQQSKVPAEDLALTFR